MSPIQNQIVIMTIIMGVGFLLGKIKMVTPDANKYLSNLLLLVVSPCLTFMSYQKEYSDSVAKNLLLSLVLALLTHIILIIIATVIFPKTKRNYEIDRLSTIFSNCSFIGVPLVSSVFGNEGVIYLTMYITVFNVIVWTYGVTVMKKERTGFLDTLKKLCTPMVISVLGGLAFFFLRITVPDIIAQPVNILGSMNTPLAMIVAGSTLAGTDFKKLVKKPKILFITLIRLILSPAIMFGIGIIAIKLGFDEMTCKTIVIASACPSAVTTVTFAHKFGNDYVYASEIFATSTLLSVISVPAVLSLFELIITRL